MATFIDIAFFEGLKPLLILLIVFAIVYGVLSKSNILGGNKSISAIVALVLGIVVMLSNKLTLVIMVLIPWFVILAIFIILVVIAFKALGLPDDSLMAAAQDQRLYWTLIVVVIILFIASLAYVFGQEELNVTSSNTSQITFGGDKIQYDSEGLPITNTDDFQHNAKATFYHPRILGFILIILISVFAVTQLTRD